MEITPKDITVWLEFSRSVDARTFKPDQQTVRTKPTIQIACWAYMIFF